jgi:hypothetical protein
LVLVKWLPAIPHLVILGIFPGGGGYLAFRAGEWAYSPAGGLVGLLALIAGVVLLFTGRYPRGVFDFVPGMDRWALRVAAYVGLMTDAYPPDFLRRSSGRLQRPRHPVPAGLLPGRGDPRGARRTEREHRTGVNRVTSGR